MSLSCFFRYKPPGVRRACTGAHLAANGHRRACPEMSGIADQMGEHNSPLPGDPVYQVLSQVEQRDFS